MPAGMNIRSQAKHLVSLLESNDFLDEGGEDEDASANYVLSSSKQEGFGCYGGVRSYTNSNTPLVGTSQKAGVVLTSHDVDITAILKSETRQKDYKNDSPESAIRSGNIPSYSTQRPTEGENRHGSTFDLDLIPMIIMGLGGKKLNLTHDKRSRSPHCGPGPGLPKISDEMKGRLKHESCIGIGSWSKNDLPPQDRVQSIPMEEEIDTVPPEIYAMFDKNWIGGVTHCPNGQQRQQPSQPPDAQFQTEAAAGPSSSIGITRNYGSLQRDVPDDDESDEELPKRRGRKAGPRDGNGEANGPRLACPFNKNDPHFFKANVVNGLTFRCCAGPGFEDIARVKAHLYRLHKTPTNCPRCGQLFYAQDLLNGHLRSTTCEVQNFVSLKSITDEIEKKLRNRKKSSLGPGERWNEIYRLIFPNEPVPSPYYEPSDTISPSISEFPETEDHESFSYRELPRAFREALDISFQDQLPEEFKSILVASLSNCLEQVSSKYHNLHQGASQSIFDAEMAVMSTPKASFNGFEAPPITSDQNYDAFNMSGTPAAWHQSFDTASTMYPQLQYPQEGRSSQTESMDLSHSRSRDSGYATNSGCCFQNCGEFCNCYDSSDVNRNSIDGSVQASNFSDALGVLRELEDPTMAPGRTPDNMLTAIPRTTGNLDEVDFLQLL